MKNDHCRVDGQLLIARGANRALHIGLQLPEQDRGAALLQGRAVRALPPLSAIRVDNPIARTLSLHQATEAATGTPLHEDLLPLRRLMLCGEWIQSHTRHIYLLHAAALLGYPNLRAMASDYPEVTTRAQRLVRLGNRLIACMAGSVTKPSNLVPGGLLELPAPRALTELEPELRWARAAVETTLALVARLPFYRYRGEYQFAAMDAESGYPALGDGWLTSAGRREIGDSWVLCEAVPPVLTGPLARYALFQQRLSPAVRELAASAGLDSVNRNPFRGVVVRAVELAAVIEEALELLRRYHSPRNPSVPLAVRAGEGWGGASSSDGPFVTRCTLNAQGVLDQVRVFSPLDFNRRALERDLSDCLKPWDAVSEANLRSECEHLVGTYAPVLSRRLRIQVALSA